MRARSKIEFSLGSYADKVERKVRGLEAEKLSERLWARDASLWVKTREGEDVISRSLGWLNVASAMTSRLDDLRDFAVKASGSGLTDVVVLGMGGSSLAPLVFSRTFDTASGHPRLHVLDSTDPGAIRNIDSLIDPTKTLFIVSSKSGSTIEPLSFFEYYFDKVKALKGDKAGDNFAAVTDAGSGLEELGRSKGFCRVFLNQSDIGGRYSALSHYGLLPAVMMGVDIQRLLNGAEDMAASCASKIEGKSNPGVRLGSTLATLALDGRDKVTFVMADELASFELWIEQLIAESTGKDGKGLIPVSGEELKPPELYNDDRVFVRITLTGAASNADAERKLKAIEAEGHPVISIELADLLELGAEFFRWEFATAAAGVVLGINPFDQPDVEDAKKRTRRLLKNLEEGGALSKTGAQRKPVFESRDFSISFDATTLERFAISSGDPKSLLKRFSELLPHNAYVGILAYLKPDDEAILAELGLLRSAITDKLCIATQLGFGPRYLHSTGQLHKGGSSHCGFIVLAHSDDDDIRIPGKGYGFAGLEYTQALGDVEALEARGRQVAFFELGSPSMDALKKVTELFK